MELGYLVTVLYIRKCHQAKALHPEQRFSIGALTKQFVASAVMLLVEDGKLGLDQPISEYIGVVPANWVAVSVRHLLNHTSGLPIDSPNDYLLSVNTLGPYRYDELLDIFKTLNLQTSPGADWDMSSDRNYAVAVHVFANSLADW